MFCINTCKVYYVLSSTTMLEFHTADEKQRFENYGAIGNIIRRRLQAYDGMEKISERTAWKGRGAQDGHLEEVFAGPLFKLAPRAPSGPQPKCLCVVSLHPTGRQWKTPQGFFTFRQIFCWTKENGKGTEEEQEGHSQAAAAGSPSKFLLGTKEPC